KSPMEAGAAGSVGCPMVSPIPSCEESPPAGGVLRSDFPASRSEGRAGSVMEAGACVCVDSLPESMALPPFLALSPRREEGGSQGAVLRRASILLHSTGWRHGSRQHPLRWVIGNTNAKGQRGN